MDAKLTVEEVELAMAECAAHPGSGYCQRCLRPWAVVETHSIATRVCGGCFALCETCNAMLSREERLVYYKKAWIKWWSSEPWEVYRAACLHERQLVQVDSVEEGFGLARSMTFYYQQCVSRRADGTYWVTPKIPPEVIAAWREAGVEMADELK